MSDTLTFTLLGTGSSGGVPRVGNQWGNCDPNNPKNQRRRCALLVESSSSAKTTTILIDAGADLRMQLLTSQVTNLDAVLLTHPHADHIFGLDDLRQLCWLMEKPIDVWMDESTSEIVHRSFSYCFTLPTGSNYSVFCSEKRINYPHSFSVTGGAGSIDVQPLLANHGEIDALGFRIGSLVYLPDIKQLADEESLRHVAGCEFLIIDALRYKPHPAHFSVDDALDFINMIKPGKAILTNMHSDLDYETLKAELPAGVTPGYDGQTIVIDST